MRRWIFLSLGIILLYLAGSTIEAVFRAWRMVPDLPVLNSNSALEQKLKLDNWLPLDQVSAAARDAIVTSEDDDFYRNKGYELKSIEDAVKTDLLHWRFKRGASTITQQVIKNVFLNRKKSLRRKIEEIILARVAESVIPKDRILEVYLNTAQFGPELYGINDASLRYFHKPPSELGPKEGAFLAMLLPSPVRYEESFTDRKLTPYAEETIDALLRRMEAEGRLAPGQSEKEIAAPLPFEISAVSPTPSPTPTVAATPTPSPTPLPAVPAATITPTAAVTPTLSR